MIDNADMEAALWTEGIATFHPSMNDVMLSQFRRAWAASQIKILWMTGQLQYDDKFIVT